MSEEKDTVKRSSFAVALEPEFNEDGKWTGEVTAFVEEALRDDLSEEELMQLRTVCGMMASTLTPMEQDEDFLDYVKEYFYANAQHVLDELTSLADEDSAPNFTRDGNVFTLNFDTKTHGSA